MVQALDFIQVECSSEGYLQTKCEALFETILAGSPKYKLAVEHSRLIGPQGAKVIKTSIVMIDSFYNVGSDFSK